MPFNLQIRVWHKTCLKSPNCVMLVKHMGEDPWMLSGSITFTHVSHSKIGQGSIMLGLNC